MMRIPRGLRRLRARWRLHRMEWAEMHAPLEPPPGYEEYATLRSNLPGLSAASPIRSWTHFRCIMREAWKLYLHDYFPNPELVAQEEELLKQRKREEMERRSTNKRYERMVVADGKKLSADLYAALPDSRKSLEDRLDVLNLSLEEFMKGYGETSTGATTLFGETMYHKDVVHPENGPVVYRVEEEV